jgi:hypothetical protein
MWRAVSKVLCKVIVQIWQSSSKIHSECLCRTRHSWNGKEDNNYKHKRWSNCSSKEYDRCMKYPTATMTNRDLQGRFKITDAVASDLSRFCTKLASLSAYFSPCSLWRNKNADNLFTLKTMSIETAHVYN